MRSGANSVEAYLAALSRERRADLGAVRALILKNLDPSFEEGLQYGMIGYFVPHRVYPAGYHVDPKQPLPFLSLASQKQNMALYLMHLYPDAREDKRFRQAWAKAGKKLDMGKSCLRFRSLDDLALDVLADTLQRITAKAYVEQYERQSPGRAGTRSTARKKAAAKSAPQKKAVAKQKLIKKKALTRSAGS